MRRRLAALTVVPAALVLLVACGGGSGAATGSSSATSGGPTVSSAITDSATPVDTSADPGPAAPTAVLPAGSSAAASLPETIGPFHKTGTTHDPDATTYGIEGQWDEVSVLAAPMTTAYDEVVASSALLDQFTAGAGVCGKDASGAWACYQRGADGTVSISPGDKMSKEQIQLFVDLFAQQRGAA